MLQHVWRGRVLSLPALPPAVAQPELNYVVYGGITDQMCLVLIRTRCNGRTPRYCMNGTQRLTSGSSLPSQTALSSSG